MLLFFLGDGETKGQLFRRDQCSSISFLFGKLFTSALSDELGLYHTVDCIHCTVEKSEKKNNQLVIWCLIKKMFLILLSYP